jgi:hypothetical protein
MNCLNLLRTYIKLSVTRIPLNKEAVMNSIDDSRNYRFGIFYYNPADRRTIVPRRIGFWGSGYTMNFAKPVSRLILIVFLVLTGFLIYAIVKSGVAPRAAVDDVLTQTTGTVVQPDTTTQVSHTRKASDL